MKTRKLLINIRLVSILLLFILGLFFLSTIGIGTFSILFITAAFGGFSIMAILDLYGYKLNLKDSLIKTIAYIGIIVNLGLITYLIINGLLSKEYLIYIGFSLFVIVSSIFWRKRHVSVL